MSRRKKHESGSGNDATTVSHAEGSRSLRKLKVVVAGRAEDTVRRIERGLARSDFIDCRLRLITNGHADPLHGIVELPDAVILVLSAGWQDELEALIDRPAASRPPAVVIGPADNVDAVRLAMRAGAKDYYSLPEDLEAIEKVLKDIASEIISPNEKESASIISVINAKGGSGATFLATTLAQLLSSEQAKKTALIDLELQFGSVTDYLDIDLRHGLSEVFEVVYELDDVALESYMTVNKDGLHVLGAHGSGLEVDEEVDEERFFTLLKLLSTCFQHVVIDLPRQLNPLTIQGIEQSNLILVVVQQNLASLKDATRLLAFLRNSLAISSNRIKIIVNRYDKYNEITERDIKRALCIENIAIIPNDFLKVSESLNTAEPIFRAFKSAPISKALTKLTDELTGHADKHKSGLLESAMTGIRGVIENYSRNRT